MVDFIISLQRPAIDQYIIPMHFNSFTGQSHYSLDEYFAFITENPNAAMLPFALGPARWSRVHSSSVKQHNIASGRHCAARISDPSPHCENLIPRLESWKHRFRRDQLRIETIYA